MNYLRSVKDFLTSENKATLSGAIDIVVVKHNDEYRCTPFHVRFGKLDGIMQPREKIVQVSINGELRESIVMKVLFYLIPTVQF